MESSWSLPSRLAFRFGIVFAALTILPFPFDVLPGTHWIASQYQGMWGALFPWFGEHVGSADPIRLQLIANIVLSVLATMCWSVVDREPRTHAWLARVGIMILRFWLASALLAYGIPKFGSTDPGLFAEGIGACAGAGLLFWRPTAILGAVIGGVLLARVIAQDSASDIRSIELVCAAVAIFVPEAVRILSSGIALAPSRLSVPWRITYVVAKVLVVGWFVFVHVHGRLVV